MPLHLRIPNSVDIISGPTICDLDLSELTTSGPYLLPAFLSMMAEEPTATDAAEAPVAQLTFNIKSSSDSKHVVTVPETMTVLELKTKLSTAEFADVPAERQRLIYSGRVLKDADPLSTYKIKDGNTVHMVKGAASNQRPSPANQSSGQSNPVTGVPQNIASGTGNDPLAGLTGARYAGFAQMPGANQFGPDGGVSITIHSRVSLTFQRRLIVCVDGTAPRP